MNLGDPGSPLRSSQIEEIRRDQGIWKSDWSIRGVVEKGRYYETEAGTPQGDNLSPVLSNIYLHYVLVLWTKHVLRKKLKGYIKLIRYADDCAPGNLSVK